MTRMQVLGEGPDDANIVIVGEAPGNEELKQGRPFVGAAGKELNSWLQRAGLSRGQVYITNVFKEKAPNNDVSAWCLTKKQAKEKRKDYSLPAIKSGKYLDPEHLHVLDSLEAEIKSRDPNLIIPLGNTALWAVLKRTGIGKIRGTLAESKRPEGYKVLPSFHPAAILRNYGQRPVALMDFLVAAEESQDPEIHVPSKEIWLDPTLEDLPVFQQQHLEPAEVIAVDIETVYGRQISHVGFSTADAAISVPFFDRRFSGGSYWPTAEDEYAAWIWVKDICGLPQPKVLQNGNYDLYWLWRFMGIPIRNYSLDTMILHHALYPEIQKDLGFLGSIYSSLRMEWKSLTKQSEKGEG